MKQRNKIDRKGRVKLRRKSIKPQAKEENTAISSDRNPGRNYEGEANIKYGRIVSTKLK